MINVVRRPNSLRPFRPAWWIGLLLVHLSASAICGAADTSPDEPCWLYLAPRRPVLIRVHLLRGGRPASQAFAVAQADYVRRLFHYLDRNGDGRLDEAEVRHAPPPQLQLAGAAALDPAEVHFAFNFRALDIDRDGTLTRDEFGTYLTAFADGFMRPQREANDDAVSAEVSFANVEQLLDRDQNGALSIDELNDAEALLDVYDENNDELLSASELAPSTNGGRIAVTELSPYRPTAWGRFLPVKSIRQAAFELWVAYGNPSTEGQRRIARDDIQFDESTFDRLDRDGDENLDRIELATYVQGAADVDLVIDLNPADDQPALVVHQPSAKGDSVSPLSHNTANGGAIFLGGAILRVAVSGTNLDVDACCVALADEVWQYDVNDDGRLERDEVQSSLLGGAVSLMDARGNDSFDKDEIAAFVEEFLRPYLLVSAHRVAAWFSTPGAGLFDLLDADCDTQLSRQELRGATAVVARCDANGDTQIQREEIPPSDLVSFAPIQAGPARSIVDAVLPPEALELLVAGDLRWFVKMDRNRDGSVSPREFLGTGSQFEALDVDKDLLIRPSEARSFWAP